MPLLASWLYLLCIFTHQAISLSLHGSEHRQNEARPGSTGLSLTPTALCLPRSGGQVVHDALVDIPTSIASPSALRCTSRGVL